MVERRASLCRFPLVKLIRDIHGGRQCGDSVARKDQGSGIPDEIIDIIGTPFFTKKDHGTGLAWRYATVSQPDITPKLMLKTVRRVLPFMSGLIDRYKPGVYKYYRPVKVFY